MAQLVNNSLIVFTSHNYAHWPGRMCYSVGLELRDGRSMRPARNVDASYRKGEESHVRLVV